MKNVAPVLCKSGFTWAAKVCNICLSLSIKLWSMFVDLCGNKYVISFSVFISLYSTVAVRITDNHFRHSECYTCTDCGLNLKMRGHFWVEDVMYCEKHAKERHQGLVSPQAMVTPRYWDGRSAPSRRRGLLFCLKFCLTWITYRLWDGVRWELVYYRRQDVLFQLHLPVFFNRKFHFFCLSHTCFRTWLWFFIWLSLQIFSWFIVLDKCRQTR